MNAWTGMTARLAMLALCACGGTTTQGTSESNAPQVDADQDGVMARDDCDDANADFGAQILDSDCDGVLTVDDCDDADADSTTIAEDGDCDGALTAEDCDDSNAASTLVAEDKDCDGVRTEDDCNDRYIASTVVATDGDCDGVLTADDCDDTDASLGAIARDADCDEVRTEDDCDDSDPTLGSVAADYDCDGSLNPDDCDDQNPSIHPGATELCGNGYDDDCDGTLGTCGGFAGTQTTNAAAASVPFSGAGQFGGRGDHNGDGLDDLLFGLSGIDKALLFDGPVSGTIDVSTADGEIIGADYLGNSVSFIGDVNGDGNDDVLLGAPREGSYGEAFVMHGPLTGTTSVSSAAATLINNGPDWSGGWAVAGSGDFNGDSIADVLVGAPSNGTGSTADPGHAYVVFGPLTGDVPFERGRTMTGDAPSGLTPAGDMAGGAVAWIGDTDGDGLDDVAVGAPYRPTNLGGCTSCRSGSAYLVRGGGAGSMSLRDADGVFDGDDWDDEVGTSVGAAGDVNGDGLADLLIGNPAYSSATGGRAYLILGPISGNLNPDADSDLIMEGGPGGQAGDAVDGNSDLDGDGELDLIISAPTYGAYSQGAVYVVHAPSTGVLDLSTVARIEGTVADTRLGGDIIAFNYFRMASMVGDLDGDGYGDMAASSRNEATVWAFRGGPGW